MVPSSFSRRFCSSMFFSCRFVSFWFWVSSNFRAVSLSNIMPHVVHLMVPKGFWALHRGHCISFAKLVLFVVVFSPCSSSMASSRSRAEKCTYRRVILLPYVQPANCSKRDSVKTFAMVVRELWRYRYGQMFFVRPAFLAKRFIISRKCL